MNKWTIAAAAVALCLGTTTADAGLFNIFKKGGCHGDDCCPTCACPEECCEDPSCCAPEECCEDPSCCAPEECCEEECCPDECGSEGCLGKKKGLFSRLFSCLKKKRNHGCCEEDCCPVECCPEPACCAPTCCAPECAAPGACN